MVIYSGRKIQMTSVYMIFAWHGPRPTTQTSWGIIFPRRWRSFLSFQIHNTILKSAEESSKNPQESSRILKETFKETSKNSHSFHFHWFDLPVTKCWSSAANVDLSLRSWSIQSGFRAVSERFQGELRPGFSAVRMNPRCSPAPSHKWSLRFDSRAVSTPQWGGGGRGGGREGRRGRRRRRRGRRGRGHPNVTLRSDTAPSRCSSRAACSTVSNAGNATRNGCNGCNGCQRARERFRFGSGAVLGGADVTAAGRLVNGQSVAFGKRPATDGVTARRGFHYPPPPPHVSHGRFIIYLSIWLSNKTTTTTATKIHQLINTFMDTHTHTHTWIWILS